MVLLKRVIFCEVARVYLTPCQTSMMEHFTEMVNVNYFYKTVHVDRVLNTFPGTFLKKRF